MGVNREAVRERPLNTSGELALSLTQEDSFKEVTEGEEQRHKNMLQKKIEPK